MNEARNIDRAGGAGCLDVLVSERESHKVLHRIEQLLSRGKVVHARHSPVKDTTEIRWNYDFEIFECSKCHAIMQYNFDFKVCPYCSRKVTHSDSRGFEWR